MVTPIVESATETEDFGRFVIEPLEAGFGLTIGNALRRVLLSALPGAAVTWVKINGVQHEFSTMEGVQEDTTELLLNVKGIRLKPLSDRPGILMLDVSGEREVTAGDISVTADFELVNPELHLATLTQKIANLSVEFNVEQGKGYQPAGSSSGLGIGVIPVDAIFTPVRKVNYLVETTRIGIENYDRLVIEIWTDGTTTPSEALTRASEILVNHFAAILDMDDVMPQVADKAPLSAISMPQKQYDTPIEDLDLSVRSYNCLKRAGITKVGQIVEMSEEDLLNVRNFGGKSLEELREKLQVRGFLLGGAGREQPDATAEPAFDDEGPAVAVAEEPQPEDVAGQDEE